MILDYAQLASIPYKVMGQDLLSIQKLFTIQSMSHEVNEL